MVKHPLSAYETARKQTVSGREVEASALLKGASLLLRSLKGNWEESEGYQELAEALRFNQKLWTIFQAELENPENPLPDELKVNILSLAIFIQRTILGQLANPTEEGVKQIAQINENLAAGLSPKLPTQEEVSQEEEPEKPADPDSAN